MTREAQEILERRRVVVFHSAWSTEREDNVRKNRILVSVGGKRMDQSRVISQVRIPLPHREN